ncbi:MAG TPA: hypothetical protein VG738_12950 [Chitinophagaceae bacterium]|nr:hypothetical protein [Chitinophagaceae bacterium]
MSNKYVRDKRILAHRILRQLTGMAVYVSEHGQSAKFNDVYMSMGYFKTPFINIKAGIQDKTMEELYGASKLLEENKHIIFEEYGVNIQLSKLEVTLPGVDAYKSEYYLELNKKDKEERVANLPQKFWYIIAILSFSGGFFADIGKEALKRKIWPDTNQLLPATPTSTDTLQKHKIVP